MLLPHERPPFEIVRPNGSSRVLLVCDHASKRIPQALGDLGLPAGVIDTHVGWDIGAASVARHLSELLDATLVLSSFSRLVIDCNRPETAPSSIPEVSCGVPIPGNVGLSAEERAIRIQRILRPYHAAIADVLDARPDPVLISVHSFTPVMLGQSRPWPIGLLYGADTRLAHAFRDWLRRDPALLVGDNEPYRVSAETDWTIPAHGEARGILNTAFEIRQDGVGDAAGQRAWAERIAQGWETIRGRAL